MQPSSFASAPLTATPGHASLESGTLSASESASAGARAGHPFAPPAPGGSAGQASAVSLTPSPSKSAVEVAGADPVRISAVLCPLPARAPVLPCVPPRATGPLAWVVLPLAV